LFSKPGIYFRRPLGSGFGKPFLRDGVVVPELDITAGTLVLESTDTPPEEGSILTLDDRLVFDPTLDTWTIALQTRED